MRNRGVAPQTAWLQPPMYRAGFTGNTGYTTAAGNTTPLGQTYAPSGPIAIGVTFGAVTIVDLTTICGTGAKAATPQGTDDYNPNPLGHNIYIQADGDNIYAVFGDSVASVTGLVPTYTTGVQTGSTGPTGAALNRFSSSGGTQLGPTIAGMKIVKDTVPWPFQLPIGNPPAGSPPDNADVGIYSPARYLAMTAGSTGSTGGTLAQAVARIWQASD